MWEKELKKAIELSVAAGKTIMKIYDKADQKVEYKADNSPLTEADKASNDIIVAGLKETFPDYAILSEEEKDNKQRLDNEYCFVVDPLDGTKEFIKRNGQFTVNIALAYKGKSVMGVIYVPEKEVLYYASEGHGSYKVEKNNDIPQKIYVSDITKTEELRAVVSNSHGCDKMNQLIDKYKIENFVKVGSSLKGCMIAEGTADIYYRFNPTMEWDTAAMQCIVEEAGGIFRQMDNSEMRYNREKSLNDKGFYAVNRLDNLFEI